MKKVREREREKFLLSLNPKGRDLLNKRMKETMNE